MVCTAHIHMLSNLVGKEQDFFEDEFISKRQNIVKDITLLSE
jgi:hypothetical protein